MRLQYEVYSIMNKKTEEEGTAFQLRSGRYLVDISGSEKEVAASTFKRWYKITDDTPLKMFKDADEVDETVEEEVEEPKKEEPKEEVVEEKKPEPKKEDKKEKEVANFTKPEPKVEKKEKPAKKVKEEVTKAKVENGVLKGLNLDIHNIILANRELGTVNSKHGVRKKYYDTFTFGKYHLQIIYSHLWSVDVKVLDGGTVIYDSPTGALNPLFQEMGISKEEQNAIKMQIRKERKQAD